MTPRLTDANREDAVAVLRRHFDEGRIDLDEFVARVERVFTVSTHDELRALVSDLPAAWGVQPRSRRARHAKDSAPHWAWRPTSERFRDPTTGRVLRVWVDAVDGTRHYVVDG